MEKFTITFAEDKSLRDYLLSCCPTEGREITTEEKGNVRITLTCSRALFRALIADAITVYYKTKIVRKALPQGKDDLLFFAYLGAVVGEDLSAEREGVEKLIPADIDVNLNGIFRFLLTEYDHLWRALGELAGKLLTASSDEPDVYALIRYFLSNGGTTKRTLIVDKTIYYDDTNEDVPCLSVSDSMEKDVAFNLLLRRPQEIILPFPKKYSDELLSLIGKLGEEYYTLFLPKKREKANGNFLFLSAVLWVKPLTNDYILWYYIYYVMIKGRNFF